MHVMQHDIIFNLYFEPFGQHDIMCNLSGMLSIAMNLDYSGVALFTFAMVVAASPK